MADTTMKLPFELDKPSENGWATKADAVGYDGDSVEDGFTGNINDDNVVKKLVTEGLDAVDFNDHTDYVDLGIKDAEGMPVLWATMNLGATTQYEAGYYIAFGEDGIDGYTNGIKPLYKLATNKYYDSDTKTWKRYNPSDGLTTLLKRNDAVNINWGGTWRIPTKDEYQALCKTDNFTWEWDSENNGYKVISKISGYEGNSIFLPMAGLYNETGLFSNSGAYATNETLWSGSNDRIYGLAFSSSKVTGVFGLASRGYGYPLRPVITNRTARKFVTQDNIATDLSDVEKLTDEQTASAKATATSLTQLALKIGDITTFLESY